MRLTVVSIHGHTHWRMSSSHTILPTELWTLVVRNLPHEERRTCLFVSRQLHDIALFILFSRVTLYFGLWRWDEHLVWELQPWKASREPWHMEYDVPKVEARTTLTWELLRHISRTPSFATVVKTVSVHAYALGDGLFETREFIRAMRFLSADLSHVLGRLSCGGP